MAPVVLAAPLDEISARARPYPAWLLPEGGTGLCLFAAAFQGHNDAIHMARMEMVVTLVDVDVPKLNDMAGLYPEWENIASDAWRYAKISRGIGRQWDVVSVDTWTGDLERRSLDSLDLWCSLARKAVTVTHTVGSDFEVPDGWDAGFFPRTDKVNWLVLTRA